MAANPNISFYRQTTGSTAKGAITFDTTNKFIYLGDGSTAHKFDCNNTIPAVPFVTATISDGFFYVTSSTDSPMYHTDTEGGTTGGYLHYDAWGGTTTSDTDFSSFTSSTPYYSTIRALWNFACNMYNNNKCGVLVNTQDETVSVCSVAVEEISGHESRTYGLMIKGIRDGRGNALSWFLSRGLTEKTFQTTSSATILARSYRQWGYAI